MGEGRRGWHVGVAGVVVYGCVGGRCLSCGAASI